MTSAPVSAHPQAVRHPAPGEAFFLLLAVLLPAILPLVRRASPVLLVAAACCAAVLLVRALSWRNSLAALNTWPNAVAGAFLAWAALTLFWAPVAPRGRDAVASGALIFVSAALLFSVPLRRPRLAPVALGGAITLACATIITDLTSGERLLHLIHARPEAYRYNMVLVSLVVFWSGLFHDGLRGGWPVKLVSGVALFAAVWVGESETAKVALLAGVAALLAACVLPRMVSIGCFALGATAAWVGFPWIPDVAEHLASLWPGLATAGHAAERLQIWVAHSQFATGGLPWGWGVEAVANAPMTSFYASAPPSLQIGLQWMHPHNNVIQIAAEMGLPGMALGLLATLFFVHWAHADERLRPARTALVASVIVVALVSHGFWQMWWWSAVAIAMWSLQKSEARQIVAG